MGNTEPPTQRCLGWGLGSLARCGQRGGFCSQNPTKILFPISGNILQIAQRGEHQFGKTGSKPTISRSRQKSAGLQCSQPPPGLLGSRPLPTENLELNLNLELNTFSHQPSGAGFSTNREISHRGTRRPPACPTRLAKCKRWTSSCWVMLTSAWPPRACRHLPAWGWAGKASS